MFSKYIITSLGILLATVIGLWQYKSYSYDKLMSDYKILEANSKLIEIQKDAMVNAIDIQNAEIDKLKVDEKKNLEEYANSLEQTNKDFLKRSEYARTLSGNEECQYIRGVINEIVTR